MEQVSSRASGTPGAPTLALAGFPIQSDLLRMGRVPRSPGPEGAAATLPPGDSQEARNSRKNEEKKNTTVLYFISRNFSISLR